MSGKRKRITDQWEREAQQDSRLTPAQKLIASRIARSANADGTSFYVSQSTMADWLGYTRETVNRAYKRLCDLGLMVKVRKHYRGGQVWFWEYRLVTHANVTHGETGSACVIENPAPCVTLDAVPMCDSGTPSACVTPASHNRGTEVPRLDGETPYRVSIETPGGPDRVCATSVVAHDRAEPSDGEVKEITDQEFLAQIGVTAQEGLTPPPACTCKGWPGEDPADPDCPKHSS